MNTPAALLLTIATALPLWARPKDQPRVDPDPQPAPKARPARRPEVTIYPGGKVWRQGRRVLSRGMGLARGTRPQDRLMAQRAAYLVAVRNAGLYLAGYDADDAGRLRRGQRTIQADLHVTNFREVESTWDPATRTATVTVEVRLPRRSRD
jgi:hypothetical protein